MVVLDALDSARNQDPLDGAGPEPLVGEASALILIPEKNEVISEVILSTNNLPDTKTILVNYLNIRDLLGFDRLVFPLSVLGKTGSDAGEVGGGSYDYIYMKCFVAH